MCIIRKPFIYSNYNYKTKNIKQKPKLAYETDRAHMSRLGDDSAIFTNDHHHPG